MNKDITLRKIIKKISILLLLTTCCANAASFDCKKAQSKIEHMICSSPDLSSLDDVMALGYLIASESDGVNKYQLAQQQTAWLAERDRCQSEDCVRVQYHDQMTKFDAKFGCNSTDYSASDAETICSSDKLVVLDKVLEKLQKRYDESMVTALSEDHTISPEEVKDALTKKDKAWSDYIEAKCWLSGISEGGAAHWKEAFAEDCRVDETYKRIKQFKAGSLD